jgi:hypothetical protein
MQPMTEKAISDTQTLSLFTSSAEKLQELAGELSETELDKTSEPGGWRIREIIHHLADDCDVWSMCIKKAIATPGVTIRFEGFPGNEEWARALEFDRRGTDAALQLIAAHRRYLAELTEHFSDRWDSTVKLANAEGEIVREMTVQGMVGMLAEHMLDHVHSIEKAQLKGG